MPQYILTIVRQSQGNPDFHRIPAPIRRPDPSSDTAICAARRAVFDAGMDRDQCVRLYGGAHASLVRRAERQADFQSVLCGVAVGGGFGVVDGEAGLIKRVRRSI